MDEKVIERNLSMDDSVESEVIVESVKHYDDRNEVELEGTLVSRYDLPTVSLLTVLTSTGRNKENTSDISVVVTGELKEKTADLKKGQRIHVTGEVRTKMQLKDNEKTYRGEVLAKTVELAKSAMEEEFGLSGRVYDQSYNKVILTGTVARYMQVNKSVAKVVLQIKSGKKTRYIETTLFARNNLKKLIPQLLVGNRLCMLCEMQSSKKEGKTEDDKPTYFKNIIVLDLKEV